MKKYTDWPFNCMEIVPVAKIEIMSARSPLVIKFPVSIIKTGIQLYCVVYIFSQIMY